jgi:hypothetical protein
MRIPPPVEGAEPLFLMIVSVTTSCDPGADGRNRIANVASLMVQFSTNSAAPF